MRCVTCNAELSTEAKFCPNCGQTIAERNMSSFVPASASFAPQMNTSYAPQVVAPYPSQVAAPYVPPVSAPISGAPVYTSAPATGWYGQPVYGQPSVDESDYYHFDATEKLDFEAMRGISIVLIVISVICVFTILFPLPLAIVSLVKACNGIRMTDPRKAKQQFSTCRTLVIISIATFVAIILFVMLASFFIDPSVAKDYGETGKELLNMLH